MICSSPEQAGAELGLGDKPRSRYQRGPRLRGDDRVLDGGPARRRTSRCRSRACRCRPKPKCDQSCSDDRYGSCRLAPGPRPLFIAGLRNLGPTLADWRKDWANHLVSKPDPLLRRRLEKMRPRGVHVPGEYRRPCLNLGQKTRQSRARTNTASGLIKHYHSLAPMAQEARKPLFLLRLADGAIGGRQQSVRDAYGHFEALARTLADAVGLDLRR